MVVVIVAVEKVVKLAKFAKVAKVAKVAKYKMSSQNQWKLNWFTPLEISNGSGGGAGSGKLDLRGVAPTTTPPVVVDIRYLTKVACKRVVELVANVEKCHSLNDFMTMPMEERAVEKVKALLLALLLR